MGEQRRADTTLIVVGLAVAVILGIGGSSFTAQTAQGILYALSSLGWVIAAALLTVRHVAASENIAAAAFMVLTIAETLLWVSGRPGDPNYLVGFAGGTMFYVAGFFLLGLSPSYSKAVRGLSLATALTWGIYSTRFLVGGELTATDPISLAGYVLVGATFVGVILATRKRAGTA